MRNRVNGSVTLIAAGLLLSGAAFAECPKFQAGNPLPTVIITTNDTVGTADAPANVFRYSNAFDLINYIDVGSPTSNPSQNARWNFSEFLPGGSSPQTGSNKIYSINSNTGLDSIPTTAASLNSNGTTSNVTSGGGIMTFRNILLSPPPTPGGGYSAPAPANLDTGSQRTISVYLISPSSATACFLDANLAVGSFSVLTTGTGNDRLTGSLCSWTSLYSGGSAFTNQWNFINAGGSAFTATPTPSGASTLTGSYAAFPAASLASTSASVGTNYINGSITGANVGYASWGFQQGALTGDRIYRVRVNLASTLTAPGSNAWWRHRIGGSFFGTTGNTEQGFDIQSVAAPTTQTGVRSVAMYAWVKDGTPSGGWAANTVAGLDSPIYIMDLIRYNVATNANQTWTASSVLIDSTTRTCLGTGTTLKNFGLASVTANDGVTPAASPTAFTAGDAFNTLNLPIDATYTTTWSLNKTSGAAVFTAATSNTAVDNQGYAPFAAASNAGVIVPATGRISIDNTKVYAFDTWISAGITPNTTTSRMPAVRLRFATDEGQNQQRDQFFSQFMLSPDMEFDGNLSTVAGGLDNSAGLQTANVAKHYSSFFFPNLNTNTGQGGQTNTDYAYWMDFIWNRVGGTKINPAGTISVERLSITQYDKPTF